MAPVQVAFYIHDADKGIVGWEANLGRGRRVPGTLMGGARPAVLPHDLVQYIVEAGTQYEHGFWGLLAKGATFRSTGRRRTKPGREVIAPTTNRLERTHLEDLRRVLDWHLWRSLRKIDS
jgi:hypothetical protein